MTNDTDPTYQPAGIVEPTTDIIVEESALAPETDVDIALSIETTAIQSKSEVGEISPENSDFTKNNKKWMKIGAPVVGVAVGIAGTFTAMTLLKGPDEPSAAENPTTTSAPEVPGGEAEVSPPTPGESPTNEEVAANPTVVHLSLAELVKRPTHEVATVEEVLVKGDSPNNLSQATEIVEDWAYNFGLFKNLGYGRDELAFALFADPNSPNWNGRVAQIIETSEDVGEWRVYGNHEDYWQHTTFELELFEHVSDDEFIVYGTQTTINTTEEGSEVTSGEHVFQFRTFEIDGTLRSGWLMARPGS